MKKLACCLLPCLFFLNSSAQIHLSKLIIKSHETFSFGTSDILVADTLVMQDSSGILLNNLKKENYLHIKVAIIGKQCFINGSGVDGGPGRNGKTGASSFGPCKSGTIGSNGTPGLWGAKGVDLLVYFTEVDFAGKLTINLAGGNGGNGGLGGQGGDGGTGTVHCAGGDGGNGGIGGDGGGGGDGGKLEVHCPAILKNKIRESLKINNRGGQFGLGGRGGFSGYAGLAPTNKGRGKVGVEGATGADGALGNNGTFAIVATDKQ
jgi:hypothetical protein